MDKDKLKMKSIVQDGVIIEVPEDAIFLDTVEEFVYYDIEKEINSSDIEYIKCLLEIQGGL